MKFKKLLQGKMTRSSIGVEDDAKADLKDLCSLLSYRLLLNYYYKFYLRGLFINNRINEPLFLDHKVKKNFAGLVVPKR